MCNYKKSGFSLIELLIVVAIIAILSSIAVPIYQRYMITARMISIGNLLQNVMQQG